ncbi:MAG TPA: lysozyme inhibitor LprI family protein [Allosphingosinicella sp.]|nr:lysozyme inhibitor LprI family protein [Allosphingosinicella sp.]
MKIRFVALAALLPLVANCDSLAKPSLTCTDEDAVATTLQVVNNKVEKQVRNALERDDGTAVVGVAKIRATLKQLRLSIQDIRTSKEDPNSTKKFCTGRFKVVVPAEVLEDAEKGRELAEQGSVADLAEQQNFEAEANAFTSDISYDVQPTDEGDKVYAQVEDGDNVYSFVSGVVASHLARKALENEKAQQQQALAAQQQEEASALADQRAATLGEAKAENQLAEQTINTVWSNIPSETRSSLLPLQRAWIKKRTADCRIEAAANSTDPQEREASRLRCDTRLTYDRANQLRGYATETTDGM